MKKLAIATLCLGMFTATSASAFTIKMVADNDYAIFSGTSSSINSILYQNNVVWNDQLRAISTQSFSLANGDDTFYVLGMGGGGQENISGLVNGVNMTDPSVSVSMSSNINSFLTGYNATAVTNGTYNVSLADVQTALANLTWGSPTVATNETVINASGFGSGFRFEDQQAHLFRFNAASVNVPTTPVSEPATFAIFGVA